MHKIFDPEVQEFLRESGVSEKEIKSIMHKRYKEGMRLVAIKLINAIDKEDYSIIKDYVGFSTSGDGYGSNNSLLNFAFINGEDLVDIEEAFELLNYLK